MKTQELPPLITSTTAMQLLRMHRGKYFTVEFIKKKDGSPRRLTGRLGVSKGTTGKGKSFDPRQNNLVTVSETVYKKDAETGRIRTVGTQFRHFALEKLYSLNIAGMKFRVQWDGNPLWKQEKV